MNRDHSIRGTRRRITRPSYLLFGFLLLAPMGRTAESDNTLCFTVDGEATAEADAHVTVIGSLAFPAEAVQFAVCHDAARIRITRSSISGTDIQALNGGSGPEFIEVQEADDHVSFGMLVNFPTPTPEALPPGPRSFLTIVYGMAPAAEPGETPLAFCPAVMLSSFAGEDGTEVFPQTCEAALTVGDGSVPPHAAYVRGDVNGDADLTISDMVKMLRYMFGIDTSLTCDKALDSNDDGSINIADAIYLGNYVFLNGDALAYPNTECGYDPTDDALTCEHYVPCEE